MRYPSSHKVSYTMRMTNGDLNITYTGGLFAWFVAVLIFIAVVIWIGWIVLLGLVIIVIVAIVDAVREHRRVKRLQAEPRSLR